MKNGYTHRFEKCVGGIKNIRLTPVCNIQNADFNPLNGRYTAISLHDPEQLAECSFPENAVRYREVTDCPNGIPSVLHSLEFHTDKIDTESDRLIRWLAAHSHCGLAAVITTQNNVRMLIGYSEEHGIQRALKLRTVSADSGLKHTDPGHEAICLSARDTAKARMLDGNIA